MSKNLTEIVRHPMLKEDVAAYVCYNKREWGRHLVTRCPGEETEFLVGPVIDRLHAFEKLGLEPEDIQSLMDAHADLLKKYGPKKVVVETEFEQYMHETGQLFCGKTAYPCVKEIRHYRCPSCESHLAIRYKITKLYPNRTVATEGNHDRPIDYKSTCMRCQQSLDWSDVDKETWV